jgi:hypothetical protein
MLVLSFKLTDTGEGGGFRLPFHNEPKHWCFGADLKKKYQSDNNLLISP